MLHYALLIIVALICDQTSLFFNEPAPADSKASNQLTIVPPPPSQPPPQTMFHPFVLKYMVIFVGTNPMSIPALNQFPANRYRYLIRKRQWLLNRWKLDHPEIRRQPNAHILYEYVKTLWLSSKQKIIAQEYLADPLVSLIFEYASKPSYGILEKLDQLIALDISE